MATTISSRLSDVPAPATGVWYDIDVTVGSVLAALRLTISDIDEPRVRALVPSAAGLIDGFLDREVVLEGPPPHPTVQAVLEELVIVLYHGTLPVPGFPESIDVVSALLLRLLPFKQRWGTS
jgi:hypothetical protein